MKKTYYHISMKTEESIGVFYPRLPKEHRPIPGEDREFKRISLSKSIEGCMNAISYYSYLEDYSLKEHRSLFEMFDIEPPEDFITDVVDDEVDKKNIIRNDSGYPLFKLYEFLIDDNDIMDTDKLKELVPDAEKTGECWATRDIVPLKSSVISPTYVEFHGKDVLYMDFDRI